MSLCKCMSVTKSKFQAGGLNLCPSGWCTGPVSSADAWGGGLLCLHKHMCFGLQGTHSATVIHDSHCDGSALEQ